jgi:uncharacterized membrane protein YraQ (UPF0718 family)
MVPKLRPEDEIVLSLAGLDEITRPIHRLRMLEAGVTFWSAILLLAIGTIVLVIGAFGSGAGMQSARLSAGALLNLIGGAILKLHKDMHTKLERFHRDRDRMHMVLQMQDKHSRDRAIQQCEWSLREPKAGWWKRLLGR